MRLPDDVLAGLENSGAKGHTRVIIADGPMRPGRPERREHEYVRHGTTLIANFNVATGQVLAPSLRPTLY
jgi:hypothetical protein